MKKLDGAGCSSTIFQVHGIKYTHVCGKIIGYQDESTDAFNHPERHIDGVSITHGYHPRKQHLDLRCCLL